MSAREIGLFPLASVLVPGELMPLHIFEERYKSLVTDCRQEDAEFALLYSDSDGPASLGRPPGSSRCSRRSTTAG